MRPRGETVMNGQAAARDLQVSFVGSGPVNVDVERCLASLGIFWWPVQGIDARVRELIRSKNHRSHEMCRSKILKCQHTADHRLFWSGTFAT